MGTDKKEGRMAEFVNILGIAGSLRKGSYNRSALRAAVKLIPPGIPPFNEDHEKEFPQAAREFKTKVSAPYGPVQWW
jgi:chromate reductase